MSVGNRQPQFSQRYPRILRLYSTGKRKTQFSLMFRDGFIAYRYSWLFLHIFSPDMNWKTLAFLLQVNLIETFVSSLHEEHLYVLSTSIGDPLLYDLLTL